MSVLAELVEHARQRADELPPPCRTARGARPDFALALRGRERVSVVAEFKRRSPSRGALAPDQDLEQQVRLYQSAGAAAVSVLTEPSRFGGSIDDLERAAAAVSLPLLMKDFVVDERQVALAARSGASAVLLIVRCLGPAQLEELVSACIERRLTPLVECHNAAELDVGLAVAKVNDGVVLGINHRNLDDLTIDVGAGEALLARIPEPLVAIAESGYEDPARVRALRGVADAALIGSALMVGGDPVRFLEQVNR